MDQESVIGDIERQAREVGVAIRELCRRAGINPTTFSRWKVSPGNPEPKGANLHSVGRLYAELEKLSRSPRPPADVRRGRASDRADAVHSLCEAAK